MGITNTGHAINVALDHLENRKNEYKNNGINFYQPLLFLISDGLSMDDTQPAANRIKELQNNKKLSFFAIGVEGASMEQLSNLSNRPAVPLKGVNFDELFVWISQSTAAVSASTPGDKVALPTDLMSSWADL